MDSDSIVLVCTCPICQNKRSKQPETKRLSYEEMFDILEAKEGDNQ